MTYFSQNQKIKNNFKCTILILRVMLAAFLQVLQNVQLHHISGGGEVFGASTKQVGRNKP